MRWLLDTTIASLALRGDVAVLRHLTALSTHAVKVSAVTQAELLYGVAKRGHPAKLLAAVRAFLQCAEPLPWSPDVAEIYAGVRAACEQRGTSLGTLDTMIAAHALALAQDAPTTLVTRDQAFRRVPGLTVETWSA